MRHIPPSRGNRPIRREGPAGWIRGLFGQGGLERAQGKKGRKGRGGSPGLAPLRPLRTGRETLASSGSYTPASGLESQKALPQTPGPPSLVGRPPRPECRVPSLRRRCPASTVLRTRPPLRLASVLGSSGVCPLEVSLGIEATGSHVPHKSLSLV